MAPWQFYGRKNHLRDLTDIFSRRRWFFAKVTGRRRIGKTTLIQQALQAVRSTRPVFYVQIPEQLAGKTGRATLRGTQPKGTRRLPPDAAYPGILGPQGHRDRSGRDRRNRRGDPLRFVQAVALAVTLGCQQLPTACRSLPGFAADVQIVATRTGWHRTSSQRHRASGFSP